MDFVNDLVKRRHWTSVLRWRGMSTQYCMHVLCGAVRLYNRLDTDASSTYVLSNAPHLLAGDINSSDNSWRWTKLIKTLAPLWQPPTSASRPSTQRDRQTR
jgi:hypothetical protein